MEPNDTTRTELTARLGLAGLLVIQAFIGYEWLMSGVTEVVRGGFPGGLADELAEKSEGTVGWYKDFLGKVRKAVPVGTPRAHSASRRRPATARAQPIQRTPIT